MKLYLGTKHIKKVPQDLIQLVKRKVLLGEAAKVVQDLEEVAASAESVSIYHMTYEMYDHISPKDVFHIIEPIKKTITVQLSSGKTVQYDCLQVDHPKALLRNGGRLTGKAQPSYMSVRCFDR